MKIFKIICYIFIVFIAATALLLIVSILPITGNYKFMVVQSGSMETAIKMGSIVLVKPGEDYKVGDIITFRSSEKTKGTITHRVSAVETQNGQALYTTKGDANNAPDQRKVQKGEIIGRVLLAVPYIGYVIDIAKKPYGFVTLIVIPAVIIVSEQVKNIFVEIKRIRGAKKAT